MWRRYPESNRDLRVRNPLCYPLHHIPFVFTDMSVCAVDLCTSPVATKLGLTAMTIPPEQLLWHVFPPLHTVYTVIVNKC